MNFFANMKISLKLSVLIGIALLSMVTIGYMGYYYLHATNDNVKSLYAERLIPIKIINQTRTNVARANEATLELMLTEDDTKNIELKKIIDDISKQSAVNYTDLQKINLDPEDKAILAKAQIVRDKFRVERIPVLQLAEANKNAEAYALYITKVQPLMNEYVVYLQDLIEHYSALAEKTNIENQEKFEKAMKITLGILVMAFLVLGISGWYISKNIALPLQAMLAVCKEFATGDFRDKPRAVVRKDEIGQVADALAEMRSAIRQLMKKINESAEHLAASSEELTASAEQSAQAANQVSQSITDVAYGAEKQLSVANDTSGVVQKMSVGIQQIAANTNKVAEQTTQAVNKAEEGNKSVNKAVTQMASIEQTVSTSAQVVSKLGERSKEIGQIIDTISGIAGQTNLLALNAAIEAARAGDQGRGFAVVAEEVRKLAEQSQDAAKKIATLIGEIQGDTGRAVAAMEVGTREVKLGAEVVNASGKAFQEIADMVTEVSAQTKEISSAIEEMARGSQQIVESVGKIDELSRKTSGEAQTVSAATEEQSASMEEIASSSQSLAHLALDLRKSVNEFQI